MKIPLNTALEVDFDPVWIGEAAAEVRALEAKWGEKKTELLDAMFVVLSFIRLEKAAPGIINRISKAASNVANAK